MTSRRKRRRAPPYVPDALGSNSPPYVPERPGPTSRTRGGVIITGRKVGEGAYGEIVQGVFKKPKNVLTDYDGEPLKKRQLYAIKTQEYDEAMHEIRILRMLGVSTHIVKYYGRAKVSGENVHRAIVLEMLDISLQQRFADSIQNRRQNYLEMAKGLFEAISVLDSKEIVHSDLHGGNIMFRRSSPNNPVLIDFGLATVCADGQKFMPFAGKSISRWRIWHPIEQMAYPYERHKYSLCTRKFDVYSMATNLIHYIYDRTKNVRCSGYFVTLFKQAILRVNVQTFKYDTLRGITSMPTSAAIRDRVEILDTDLQDAYSCFELRSGFPKLCLYMPDGLAALLRQCLMKEEDRPNVGEVIAQLSIVDTQAEEMGYDPADLEEILAAEDLLFKPLRF